VTKGATVGFESSLPFAVYQQLQKICKAKHCRLVDAEHLIQQLRMIKSEWEINLMRKAAELTDKVFAELLRFIRAGRTEKEISRKITLLALALGCDELAFLPSSPPEWARRFRIMNRLTRNCSRESY